MAIIRDYNAPPPPIAPFMAGPVNDVTKDDGVLTSADANPIAPPTANDKVTAGENSPYTPEPGKGPEKPRASGTVEFKIGPWRVKRDDDGIEIRRLTEQDAHVSKHGSSMTLALGEGEEQVWVMIGRPSQGERDEDADVSVRAETPTGGDVPPGGSGPVDRPVEGVGVGAGSTPSV